MSKQFRPWNPEPSFLFPPSPRDWLPENHLVYFLLDVIPQMNLQPILQPYQNEERGQPPYHPTMLVTLLLYGYATGTFSSRRLMARCETDAAYRVIVGDDIPDFRTISDFRKRHLTALEGLFVDVLKLCAQAGLAKVGRIALDGSKVKANASRHKAMSYDYMLKEEQRLKQEIKGLLAQAEAADQAEDQSYGRGRRGEELPEELARRQSRLKKIREAKAALEAEAREAARVMEAERQQQGTPPSGKDPEQAKPEPKAQYNFTDPESHIMKVSNKGWDQCGNAQVAVNEYQIIVAADVTDETNDKKQVEPMVEQLQENLVAAGVTEKVKEMVADSGFFSEANVTYLEGEEIDPYIATERLKHHEQIDPPRGRSPKGLSAKQRMARKLRTKKGRERYARRKAMVEPVFGQVKHGRGFRQFSLRGLKQMRAEWRLVSLTHNLLKLWRHEQSQRQSEREG
jgi:transposase/cell division septum initiation protein DivIVA